ncbi:Fis family transcriptional regulator [Petrotoga sp. HWH.PT.55.6.1]|jgi:response regulator NasT|uniref:ANTAR domain-containing response regulator n=1 Tax=unclassified Petrotoga TaxID=2620614 RepID=UPI000CA050C8|nr:MULTISPECIES: response regulator [unclassified Petrotoga]PNR90728.1 Fis family transcriptional regulator [Petrotoga sp. HWHPT.55.6.3]RPD35963.1 Fis family transcriptional regulator [Petrotoga sp. HWH.PT.55.6.1]
MKDLKVLVAEDEYLILMGLKSNLENLGCKVVGEATNGKELIKLALEKKPDMIIADINLPVMDGLEALRRINEKVFIPTLIVSGYDDEELIDKAKNLGVLGYLIKPIDESDLKAAIEIALSRFEEIKNLKNELEVTKETLESRKIIEKAKGIIMERLQLNEEESMKFLQKKSRNSNQKLVDVAKEIIEADKAFRID